jgi:hypothetical protein
MADDSAHSLNFLKSQADFTYTITVKEIKIAIPARAPSRWGTTSRRS